MRDLVDLAQRKAMESRDALIGNIADLFLDERARLSDRERSLMTGVLRTLIGEVERDLRRALASRLEPLTEVPAAFVRRLADGGAEIARPILLRGRSLRSVGLIGAVKMRCREHRLGTALQPRLAMELAAPQVPATEDVIEALLRDADTAAALAETYLVAEAERVDRRQMPLLPRADLPEDLVRLLFWSVAAALRAHVLDRTAIDPGTVDDAIEAVTRDLLASQPAPSTPAVEKAATDLMDHLAVAGSLNAAALPGLLRAGRVTAFLAGLARLCDLPYALARRIVLELDGASLAILCRAGGVEREVFVELLGLLHRALADTAQLPGEARNSILALYDKMTLETASAALAFWRRDPEFVAAIDHVAAAPTEPAAND